MVRFRSRALRLGLLVALAAGILAIAHYTGVRQWLSLSSLRAHTAAAGPYGVGVFGAAFVLAVVLHLPAVPFIAAAILLYGRLGGGLISWCAGVVSISITFFLARTVGGQLVHRDSLSEEGAGPIRLFMRRVLLHLHDRPVRTVFILRCVMALAPPLNFALAVTGVRFRHYFVGSALGLIWPIAAACFWVDWLAAWVLPRL